MHGGPDEAVIPDGSAIYRPGFREGYGRQRSVRGIVHRKYQNRAAVRNEQWPVQYETIQKSFLAKFFFPENPSCLIYL
ncbi:unnamed protein product [Gongylonema pulchrum]|uniref:Uncharacterized protein n=1 Tax=Gongylonema pulchrum TaxID=637853 RepID=A0A183EMF2_9BILA|nr:unnamed protein product [Gongylonema pulchrum]